MSDACDVLFFFDPRLLFPFVRLVTRDNATLLLSAGCPHACTIADSRHNAHSTSSLYRALSFCLFLSFSESQIVKRKKRENTMGNFRGLRGCGKDAFDGYGGGGAKGWIEGNSAIKLYIDGQPRRFVAWPAKRQSETSFTSSFTSSPSLRFLLFTNITHFLISKRNHCSALLTEAKEGFDSKIMQINEAQRIKNL